MFLHSFCSTKTSCTDVAHDVLFVVLQTRCWCTLSVTYKHDRLPDGQMSFHPYSSSAPSLSPSFPHFFYQSKLSQTLCRNRFPFSAFTENLPILSLYRSTRFSQVPHPQHRITRHVHPLYHSRSSIKEATQEKRSHSPIKPPQVSEDPPSHHRNLPQPHLRRLPQTQPLPHPSRAS